MKTIGGVGYILSIIPVVSLVSPVLVGIAWYQMGSKTRQGVFKATGVFMIATFLAAVAFLAIFSAIFLQILAAAFAAGGMGVVDPSTLVAPILGSLLAFVGFAVVLGVLGLVVFVLELVSHFRAAGLYGNNWFRRAAWLRIITVILVFVVIGVIFGTSGLAITPNAGPEILMSAMFLPMIPLVIIGLLSVIFSAVAFFTLQEEIPPPPP
jgi:hypothetical protein